MLQWDHTYDLQQDEKFLSPLTESEDEECEEGDDVASIKGPESKQDVINKYRSLLKTITDEEDKKKNGVQMEISWGVGLEEKTKELMKEKNKKVTKAYLMKEKN